MKIDYQFALSFSGYLYTCDTHNMIKYFFGVCVCEPLLHSDVNGAFIEKEVLLLYCCSFAYSIPFHIISICYFDTINQYPRNSNFFVVCVCPNLLTCTKKNGIGQLNQNHLFIAHSTQTHYRGNICLSWPLNIKYLLIKV